MNRINKNEQFTINSNVEFIPSRRELVDVHRSIKIRLQVPASLCFKKLLDENGNIVSQQELILCGWGPKRNRSINTNTFYQSILHLRRSLAKVGLNDVIDTVPRHGLKLNANIHIDITYCTGRLADNALDTPISEPENNEIIADVTPSPSNDDRVCRLNTLDLNADNPTSGSELSDDIVAEETTPGTVTDTGISNSILKKGSALYLKYILILLIPVFLIYAAYHYPDQSPQAFEDYVQLNDTSCNIFSQDRHLTRVEIKDLLQQAGVTCRSNATIFLTVSPLSSQLNIAYCSEYVSKRQNCQTITVMKDIKVKNEN
ncbi:winged helix-turn-helix domain-containing protein [Klebsiella sp. I138]|uniref:winged helix-turn-helix domain-containing protein n=1 Tax=Klebsiella sp. I138 TaxID=2755385 RepID=UPI003DA9F6BC